MGRRGEVEKVLEALLDHLLVGFQRAGGRGDSLAEFDDPRGQRIPVRGPGAAGVQDLHFPVPPPEDDDLQNPDLPHDDVPQEHDDRLGMEVQKGLGGQIVERVPLHVLGEKLLLDFANPLPQELVLPLQVENVADRLGNLFPVNQAVYLFRWAVKKAFQGLKCFFIK
ncbi:MAG: hypothetical protein BWY86_00932 [Candidatus Aminicenantes bacterium ADurb.Bin508]|nr:MAG: hypothetical protein BWY86_00932 [Candidatus Aminicenantes bacterium ADurb.Bin508]